MVAWKDVLSKEELQVYNSAGYGKSEGPGKKPAVLVIDVTTAFIGDKPEPTVQSIKRFPSSCGESGWKAMLKIKELLEVARRKNVPVIYSANDSHDEYGMEMWARKQSRMLQSNNLRYSTPEYIAKEISPRSGDLVVKKSKPSVFFATSLLSSLISMGVDTLIVTGCTTSGCVRATAVDAFSYNYRVVVVEECTFDRAMTPHNINLFDISQKYGDVISLSAVETYIGTL